MPRTFQAWINPLAFREVDEPWVSAVNLPLSAESVVSYACQPGATSDLESVVGRYREISQEPIRLFAAPSESRILEKLVWPLRHAKASYMFGNYLSVIALCGMVGEMVAILCWEIGEPQLAGQPMTRDGEKAVLGSAFERLGQERRVQVLGAYELIGSDMRGRFDTLRETRRKYLHVWSQDHAGLPADARACFTAAVHLVTTVIGQEVSDGWIKLNPKLVGYLERHGIMNPSPDDAV